MTKKWQAFIAILLAFCMMIGSGVLTVSATTEETFDTYDEITLSDLGLDPGHYTNALSDKNQSTYNATSPSYSFVLKFYWRANLIAGDGNSELCIAPDGKYNHGYGLWFRGDHLFFCWTLDDAKKQLDPITSGDHLVEFGRKKVLTGENTGKYYVYVKIDDQLVEEAYTVYFDHQHTAANNSLFVRGNNDSLPNQRFANFAKPDDYEAYDVIGYSDLMMNGSAVGSETALSGEKTFTYNSTSPSHSFTFNFRWTAGDTPRFNLYPDKSGSFPFALSVKNPNKDDFGAAAGPNGAFDLDPSKPGITQADDHPIIAGKSYNIEYGRLKVAKGANAGKYYIYTKVDGDLVAEQYYDGVAADGSYNNGVQLNNTLTFEVHGVGGTKISATLDAEKYDTYDEVEYAQFIKSDGSYVGATTGLTGLTAFSYNGTSPSHSVILKYNWTAGSLAKMHVYFDQSDSYPFALAIKYPNFDGLGAKAGPNGAWHINPANGANIIQMTKPLTPGKTYKIEYGRLKVLNGTNAGKYYIFLKVNGTEVASCYYDGVAADGTYGNGVQMSYNFFFEEYGVESTVIGPFADVQEEEEEEEEEEEITDPDALYYNYDVINYTDLKDESGKALNEETTFTSAKTFTYDRTSLSGSAIIKYRWIVGTVPKFQLSFEQVNSTTMGYVFGVQVQQPSDQYPNGDLWLRPGYGPHINLPMKLETDNIYDIEFARLKVAKGENKGKYYVYFKIDGELIAEDYVGANIVKNKHYITLPGSTDLAISNQILMTFYGSYGNILSETWDIGKGYYVNYYANGNLVDKVPFTFDNPTIVGKEPAVPQIPNTVGVWEPHPVTGLTQRMTVHADYTVTVPETPGTDIALNAFNGATVDLNTDIVNAYRETPMAQQSDYVRNYHHSVSGYQDYQNITFRWSDLGKNDSYTVYFADNQNFKHAFIVTTADKELVNKVGIFTPGKTYYWFVTGNDTGVSSAIDTFTAQDKPVRYISAGTVTNMRDEGGYATTDGKTVNYGLIYRGASFDEDHSHTNEMTRNVFRYLGIKSEIELRGGLAHNRTGWDEGNTNVYNIAATGYSPILTIDDGLKAEYKATFEAMADRSNYPFYFHCSAGADRTGTFGYLLNGLLGVPYEILREDYELTTFSEVGRRAADVWGEDGDSFDKMHASMMEQYGDGSGNVSVAIANFLTQYVGVDQETLDSIKQIMLESDPMDLDGNGLLGADDVVVLKAEILSGTPDPKCDLNADGYIDVRDLIRLKKALAG